MTIQEQLAYRGSGFLLIPLLTLFKITRSVVSCIGSKISKRKVRVSRGVKLFPSVILNMLKSWKRRRTARQSFETTPTDSILKKWRVKLSTLSFYPWPCNPLHAEFTL
ncbi:hypothetical protein Tcan_00754, partial [Toxocara canis]